METALRVAPKFGITESQAKEYSNSMVSIVRDNWERLAKNYGISRRNIEDMRVAFY